MSAHRTSLVRTITVGCALAGAVAVVGAAPAAAAPGDEPSFTSHTFRTDFFSGDPFPFAYETLDAATNGTGVVRLAAGPLCNSVTPRCQGIPGFSKDLSVQWINFANGRSGTTVVGQTPTTITTGGGPVGIAVAAVYQPGLPSLGLVYP